MAKKVSLIGRKTYRYNDNITILIPTIAQIRGDNEKDEDGFWNEVSLFIKTPSDMISELDALGMDFEELSDYELFLLLFSIFTHNDNKSCDIFENFSLWDLKPDVDKEHRVIFVDKNGKEIINEQIYNDLSKIIADMTGTKKTEKKKFGNAFAKKKRIERDYYLKEKARKEKDKNESILDSIILRLVCNSNFPYDFESIQNVTIYDTMYGLKQIDKDISVGEIMDSRLVGADLNKLPKEALSRYVIE